MRCKVHDTPAWQHPPPHPAHARRIVACWGWMGKDIGRALKVVTLFAPLSTLSLSVGCPCRLIYNFNYCQPHSKLLKNTRKKPHTHRALASTRQRTLFSTVYVSARQERVPHVHDTSCRLSLSRAIRPQTSVVHIPISQPTASPATQPEFEYMRGQTFLANAPARNASDDRVKRTASTKHRALPTRLQHLEKSQSFRARQHLSLS